MKVGIMFSGGIDSSVIFAQMVQKELDKKIEKVYLFAFDDDSLNYKTRRSVAIEQVAQHYGMYDRVKTIRLYKSEELRGTDTFGLIGGYKLAMQIACMAYCQKLGVTKLYMGYSKENDAYPYTFKDEQPSNIYKAEQLYNQIYDTDIEVVLPYQNMTKADIIDIGFKLNFPFEKTISCRATKYGGLIHCGRCYPCHSRINGFKEGGVEDPTDYWHKDGKLENLVYADKGSLIVPKKDAAKKPIVEDDDEDEEDLETVVKSSRKIRPYKERKAARERYEKYVEPLKGLTHFPTWSQLSYEQKEKWYS